MSVLQAVANAFAGWPGPSEAEARTLVPTHCLYPSNSAVMVVVEGGREEFIVHDDGGAVDEVGAAGARTERAHKLVGHILRPLGLVMSEDGVIRAPRVRLPDVLGTIVLVANASKEVAHDLLGRHKPRGRRNFRSDLNQLLEIKFPKMVTKNVIMVGASNKAHKFDNAVRLGDQRQLVLHAVMHDPGSINAAVVAHLDLGRAAPEGVEQRIIYDDSEPWSAADLSLLQVGARPVAFSRLSEALDRLAA